MFTEMMPMGGSGGGGGTLTTDTPTTTISPMRGDGEYSSRLGGVSTSTLTNSLAIQILVFCLKYEQGKDGFNAPSKLKIELQYDGESSYTEYGIVDTDGTTTAPQVVILTGITSKVSAFKTTVMETEGTTSYNVCSSPWKITCIGY